MNTSQDYLHTPDIVRTQFPGKKVFVRPLGMTVEEAGPWYRRRYGDRAGNTIYRNIPNVVVINEWDSQVVVTTNSLGLIGGPVDRSERLVAIWGDSVVAGYGQGWIDNAPDHIPGFQVLNGGLTASKIMDYVDFAITINRRLPIEHNLLFAGWNLDLRREESRAAYEGAIERAVRELPGVALCTGVTSLNEDVVCLDPAAYAAEKTELGYRAGFRITAAEGSDRDWAEQIFANSQYQRRIIEAVRTRHRAEGREILCIDLYSRYYTRGLPDFRRDFVDGFHYRVERYPELMEYISDQILELTSRHQIVGEAR